MHLIGFMWGLEVKIGGLSLKEDMERLRVIREVIGDKDLMVDVNRAWDYRRPEVDHDLELYITAYISSKSLRSAELSRVLTGFSMNIIEYLMSFKGLLRVSSSVGRC